MADSHIGLPKYTEFESRLRSVIPGGGIHVLVKSLPTTRSDDDNKCAFFAKAHY